MRQVFSDILAVFRRNGNLVTQLIIINLIVFFGYALLKFGVGLFPETSFNQDFITNNALVNGQIIELLKHPWTLVLFPFTQHGIFSLIFDLIIIYWFGNMMSDLIGHRKMAITYVVGSIVGLLFFYIVWGIFARLNPGLSYTGFLYGASAGTFAIMYAYYALNPDSEIMFFTFRIKTRYIIFAFLVLSFFRNPAFGMLDLGGAIFGYLQVKLLRSGINITSGIERVWLWIESLPKKKKKSFHGMYAPQKAKVINFTSKNNMKSVVDVEPSQEEVDYLLDKIGKDGYDSLSKEEKERLHKASHNAD